MVKFPQKRLLLIAFTVCLALAALPAEFFVFTSLGHDCDGMDCPVCLQMEIAQNALKGFAFAVIAAFFIAFSSETAHIIKKVYCYCIYFITPVTLHVKSNT